MGTESQDLVRAVAHEQFGPPGDVLSTRTLAFDGAPGPGHLLIDVLVRPVHPGDLAAVVGPGSGSTGDRRVPGLEGMGVVVAVGPGVETWKPGMRVAFLLVPGAWAERVVAPAALCVALPDALDDAHASLALVNTITALEVLRAAEATWNGEPRPMLQTAAGSSVGQLISMHAAERGYTLVNVVRSVEGANALKDRNPSTPTFATSEPDWLEQVRDALQASPSVILDAVGGSEVGRLLDLLEDDGTLVSYGALAGPTMPVASGALVTRGLRIQGVSIGRWLARRTESQQASDIAAAIELAVTSPHLFEVAASYDLEDFQAAVEHAQRPGKAGTVVLWTARRGES